METIMQTQSFRTLAIQYTDQDYYDYHRAIFLLENSENGIITEGILHSLSAAIRGKIAFIKEIAEVLKVSLDKILEFFKDGRIFNFFKSMEFSFEKLWKILKQGYEAYITIQKVIASYVASQGVVKWTKGKLHELDLFLQDHPLLKKFGGLVVGGILLYIWLNMSFTGDFEFDMNFDDIMLALSGRYSLGDLFASEEGVRMLMLFATGVLTTATFPWPKQPLVPLIVGVMTSIQRLIKKKI